MLRRSNLALDDRWSVRDPERSVSELADLGVTKMGESGEEFRVSLHRRDSPAATSVVAAEGLLLGRRGTELTNEDRVAVSAISV